MLPTDSLYWLSWQNSLMHSGKVKCSCLNVDQKLVWHGIVKLGHY